MSASLICFFESIFLLRMKEVELDDDHKALLVHQNGCFTAISNKCTHYGAPLVKG